MKKFIVGLITGLILVPVTLNAVGTVFWDIDSADWYASAAMRLRDYGVISGYPDGSLQPSRPVSRAELAVMLDRVLQKVDKEYAKQAIEQVETSGSTEITIYLTDEEVLMTTDCNTNKPIKRSIPKTTKVADAALRELFKPLSQNEISLGVTNSSYFPYEYHDSSVKSLGEYYDSIAIKDGIARVYFTAGAKHYFYSSFEENGTVYMSGLPLCQYGTVHTPIGSTLRQFSTINSIEIYIDGELLEPQEDF